MAGAKRGAGAAGVGVAAGAGVCRVGNDGKSGSGASVVSAASVAAVDSQEVAVDEEEQEEEEQEEEQEEDDGEEEDDDNEDDNGDDGAADSTATTSSDRFRFSSSMMERLNAEGNDDDDEGEADGDADEADEADDADDADQADDADEADQADDGQPTSASSAAAAAEKKINTNTTAKPITEESIRAFNAQLAQRGVLFFSRLPRGTTPHRLRQQLSEYGQVGRIFLRSETDYDKKVRKRRGGKVGRFNDGWVEMMDKRIAKRIALTLNNTTVGGKKRNYRYDDIWNVKYLSKFQWTHLTEKIAYERHVREAKVREEMTQSKRESNFYLQQVEDAKRIQLMEKRREARKAKRALEQPSAGASDAQQQQPPPAKKQRIRDFPQRSLLK